MSIEMRQRAPLSRIISAELRGTGEKAEHDSDATVPGLGPYSYAASFSLVSTNKKALLVTLLRGAQPQPPPTL